MNRAGEKLRSNRGASLFVALLLFLVCAVVGSAVLTAGTAASGRFSELAKSEQRYYAVNSAAELLKEQICGKANETVIERVKEETYLINAEGETVDPEGNPTTSPISTAYTNITPSGSDKLRYLLACYLVFGTDSVTVSGSSDQFDPDHTSTDVTLPDWIISVEDANGQLNALKVKVKAKIKSNGELELTLQNDGDPVNVGSDKYQLRMVFNTITAPEVSKFETTTPLGTSQEKKVTTTKTNTVQWSMGEVSFPEGSST